MKIFLSVEEIKTLLEVEEHLFETASVTDMVFLGAEDEYRIKLYRVLGILRTQLNANKPGLGSEV